MCNLPTINHIFEPCTPRKPNPINAYIFAHLCLVLFNISQQNFKIYFTLFSHLLCILSNVPSGGTLENTADAYGTSISSHRRADKTTIPLLRFYHNFFISLLFHFTLFSLQEQPAELPARLKDRFQPVLFLYFGMNKNSI